MFLSSLLVNEVSQGSRDIEILRSLFSDLFVGEICNLESKRSNMIQMVKIIGQMNVMKTIYGKTMTRKSVSYKKEETLLRWA